MKTAVITGASVSDRLPVFETYMHRYAKMNTYAIFKDSYDDSYVDVSILIGLLLQSRAVDFVMTGCSSGQGMMLACNSIPGVLCGFVKDVKDMDLFLSINHGNAVSLALKQGYGWSGEENLEAMIREYNRIPMERRCPQEHAERKNRDTAHLKQIREISHVSFADFLNALDDKSVVKIRRRKDIIEYILKYGRNPVVTEWLKKAV